MLHSDVRVSLGVVPGQVVGYERSALSALSSHEERDGSRSGALFRPSVYDGLTFCNEGCAALGPAQCAADEQCAAVER